MSEKRNVYGEGNYEASRTYNDATRKFAQSGKVEEAAREAEPTSEADALEMAAAEAEGKRHAKGEDPALRAGPKRQPSTKPDNHQSKTAPETPQAPKPGEDKE